MKEITFPAAFGDETKQVEISKVSGVGGSFHVLIDRYYAGSIICRNDDLVFIPGKPENFTTDDIQILEDKVREYLANTTSKGP